MKKVKYSRQFDCEMTEQEAHACRYLDRHGLIFGNHFGYANAIEIAESMRRARNGDEVERTLLTLRGIHLRTYTEAVHNY